MKTYGKNVLKVLALTLVSAITLSSCEKEEEAPKPTKDIVELAQATSALSTLVTAITTAELVSTFKGTGPYTVFAPSNAAFEKLEEGVLDILIANPTVLVDLLKYHVVSGKKMSADLAGGSLQTLLTGKSISVTVSMGSVKLNGSSNVTTADVDATNGVVHIIDEVLLPEGFQLPKKSIAELATGTASLSILTEALTKFPNLVSALSGSGSFTVFAPTNDAFTALLGVIGQTSLNDIPESVIERLLKYHVIAGASLKSTDLTDGQEAATLLSDQDKLTVDINGTAVKINNANVTTANVEASNGIVHIVDAVLVPELELSIVNTIVEPAYFNKNFSILTAAVVTAGLLDELTYASANLITILSGNGPFTVFAPTDAAFNALYQLAGVADFSALVAAVKIPAIEAVLKYHVVGARVFSTDLPNLTSNVVTTLGGNITLNPGTLTITDTDDVLKLGTPDASIINTDISGTNGVIHVIDKVLLP